MQYRHPAQGCPPLTISLLAFKEALNKSSLSALLVKIGMIIRRATQVVAGTTMPRSATR
jgi:hypothetical protein